MGTPRSTFNTGLQMAIEASAAVAPSLDTNSGWWQGGRWFDLSSDGLPTIDDRTAIIFPAGQAGRRAVNTRKPVRGRKWSDGDINYHVSSDVLAAILYGAMGTLSTNRVNGTNFELLTDEPLEGGVTKQLVLTSQPADGGNILRFVISGASAPGTISLSGIDPDGQGASEVISFSSAGSFYTRKSFSAIAASGIEISGEHGGASVNVHGIQYFEHTISMNNVDNPTIALYRYGDPTAGATSKQRYHPAMVVQQISLTNPAEQRDGILMGAATFEGYPTATCTAGQLNALSAVEVWPSWTQKVTKNGADWNKVTNFTLQLGAGNRNYRTAAGARNPQGQVFLDQELTGTMQLFVDSEEEYEEWLATSQVRIISEWDSPYKLTATANELISASMNSLYFENVTKEDNDGLLQLSADYRTIEDADIGIFKVVIRNRVPGIAYGNEVS
jgi:hypothetical protein